MGVDKRWVYAHILGERLLTVNIELTHAPFSTIIFIIIDYDSFSLTLLLALLA